jgi:16S rRNA (uracil1498-N3)-methyltransferase
VTVGFALSKGDRPQWATQKLTEVGVDHIRPIVTARTVVRWDADRAARNQARLARVAREAAMQARRAWLPVVEPAVPLAEAVQAAARLSPVALAQRGGRAPSLQWPAVLVGPEGGWAPEELGSGLPTVGLGPGLLRVETAAVAAGILLCALRAGVVTPG